MNNYCLNLHFSLFRQCLPLLPWRRLQGQRWWQRWWVVNFQCFFNDSSSVSSGCCKSVTIQATGAAAERFHDGELGTYVHHDAPWEYHQGAMLYKGQGRSKIWNNFKLFRHDGTWRVSVYPPHYNLMWSTTPAPCPVESCSQWQFSDFNGVERSGNITIQCA